MPIDRRDRMFMHLEKSIDRLKVELASARADRQQPQGGSPERVIVLEREIEVREKVRDELQVIE